MKMEPKMLEGALGARRMEGARSSFSGNRGAGGGYETGRGLRVEVSLRGGEGAGGLSRNEALRVTGAPVLGRSLDLRRACVCTCITSRSNFFADDPLLASLSLE